jgi:hypothetical protein
MASAGGATALSTDRMEALDKLAEDGDLLLVCKDDKRLACHRVMLAICSPVLKELLALDQGGAPSTSAGAGPTSLNVKDDDADAWKHLLSLVYPMYPPASVSWVSAV